MCCEQEPEGLSLLPSLQSTDTNIVPEPCQDGPVFPVNPATAHGFQQAETELGGCCEEGLAKAKFFDTILDSINDYIFAFDREKRIVYTNLSFAECMGLSREMCIGENLRGIGIPSKLCQELFLTGKQVVASGEPANGEFGLVCPGGSLRRWEYILTPFADTGCESVIVVAREVTDTRQAEKVLARMDRLNGIGQMAASISHEIRNPLTTIRGFLQLLNERETDSKNRFYYEVMIKELDRANSIITNYLSMARNKVPTVNVRCLSETTEEIFPMLNADAMYGDKEVKLDLEPDCKVMMDEKEVRQLIINLVRNGLEAMRPGGIVTVRTRLKGPKVLLQVADQGTGIPEEILDKLGTPFVTTKEKGTGLGLAVCYAIVNRHHATIEVDSGKGGTTFSICFPLIGGAALD